jgi:uncharacterized protein YpuA (DUF1002 family)
MEENMMKKRNVFAALMCSLCLAVGSPMPAMADAVKVVTLGADLTDAQKTTMMNYFKVDSSQVQILTVTNQDERDRLSAYVPLEQIGSRTVSCAYVKPTESGGIKVRTANLNWVTCNMIASTLSTAGVTNCEVVAACPFEVSGTGALTGILMAYESASGENLDETKKALATEEMVVTGNLGDAVGQDQATYVINEAKKQIIANNIQNADEIQNVVVNIAQQNNVQIDDSQLDVIVSLLEEIAQQQYDYDEIKETLNNIENYLSGESSEDDEDEPDPDSIIDGLDESVLGDNVIASSTEDPTLEETTQNNDDEEWDYVEDTSSNAYTENDESGEDSDGYVNIGDEEEIYEENTDASDEYYEETSDADAAESAGEYNESEEVYTEDNGEYTESEEVYTESDEENEEDTLNTDALDAEDLALFEKAQTFCKGEYEGDLLSLQTALGDDAELTVYLDSETAQKLSKKVQKIYLDVLEKVMYEGEAAYTADGTETYLTMELNMLNTELKKLFDQDDAGYTEDASEDILLNVSEEEKQTLYKDTMKFFASLYNENVVEEDSYEEESYDEESYTEESSEEYEEEAYEE